MHIGKTMLRRRRDNVEMPGCWQWYQEPGSRLYRNGKAIVMEPIGYT
jgi:hypothetical protein